VGSICTYFLACSLWGNGAVSGVVSSAIQRFQVAGVDRKWFCHTSVANPVTEFITSMVVPVNIKSLTLFVWISINL